MGFREEDHRGDAPFSSHPVKGPCYEHHGRGNLDHLAEGVFVRFLPGMLLFLPPFYIVLFGRKSLHEAHTEGVGRYIPSSWGWSVYINYLEFFGRVGFSSFTNSTMGFHGSGLMSTDFMPWLMLHSVLFILLLRSFRLWPLTLSVCSCVPLTSPCFLT